MKRACPEFRVSCLQMQYDIWLFTAMLGYLSSRTLYWLEYNIYRAGNLSKAVSARSQANTGSAWQQSSGVQPCVP
jgi:hypothetical protein